MRGLTKQERQRRKVRRYYRLANLRRFRRWWRTRCAGCGRRLYFDESGVGVNSETWHDVCERAHRWNRIARERLVVLAVVVEVWDVKLGDVEMLLEGRVETLGDEANARNIAFRAFYDMGKVERA